MKEHEKQPNIINIDVNKNVKRKLCVNLADSFSADEYDDCMKGELFKGLG